MGEQGRKGDGVPFGAAPLGGVVVLWSGMEWDGMGKVTLPCYCLALPSGWLAVRQGGGGTCTVDGCVSGGCVAEHVS